MENKLSGKEFFKVKRKWQIAFRRYVLMYGTSKYYSPYFGLSINKYREWIELQFIDKMSWENYGSYWEFDHIIPVTYFDFTNDDELKLCWSFLNLRVDTKKSNQNRSSRLDVLSYREYFLNFYEKTGVEIAKKMVEKIDTLEIQTPTTSNSKQTFIENNLEYINILPSLGLAECIYINEGMPYQDVLLLKNRI